MAIAPTLGQNGSSAGWNVTFDPVSGNLMAGGRVVSLSESELAALRAWVTSTAGLDSVGFDTTSGTIKSEGVSVTLSQVENAAVRALLADAITRTEADAAYLTPAQADAAYADKATEDIAALAESTAVAAKHAVEELESKAVTTEVDPVTGGNIFSTGVMAPFSIANQIPMPVDLGVSPLGCVPLQVTTDNVAVTLGPTAQANANSEWSAETSGKIVIPFMSGGAVVNRSKLFEFGTAFVYTKYGITADMQSSPWPTTTINDWWGRGGMRFFADGEGTILISYALNGTNQAAVLVDGKRISGSATDGNVSNAVSSTGNARQWVKIVLTGDRRRLITLARGGVTAISHSPGITLTRPTYAGKAIVFGDSFASRVASAGETSISRYSMASNALELLGYDVIDASTGGTGFANSGGGPANGKGSYLDYMNYYETVGIPLGFDPQKYSLIWLFGTGNDATTGTVDSYGAVIRKALALFPNAAVVVTSVYEGFNTTAEANRMNGLLYAAVTAAASPRVVWVPVDSAYKSDGVGIWSGTGSVPAPTGNGNADVYFSNAAQGAGDRHPNTIGVAYASKFYAAELVRAGIRYARQI